MKTPLCNSDRCNLAWRRFPRLAQPKEAPSGTFTAKLNFAFLSVDDGTSIQTRTFIDKRQLATSRRPGNIDQALAKTALNCALTFERALA